MHNKYKKIAISILKALKDAIKQACKVRPCTLPPHYFPSFTKLPLWESQRSTYS